jgi:hypothetical protein
MAGKVERFEELKCWQKARELVAAVYNLCNHRTTLATQKDYLIILLHQEWK